MRTLQRTTDGGTRSTYRYEIGPIDWDGRRMNAMVIGGFPLEGGWDAAAIPVKDAIVDQLLAENPEVAEGLWIIFCRRPPNLPFPEWELIETGSGRQLLSKGDVPFDSILESIVHQLQGIFNG